MGLCMKLGSLRERRASLLLESSWEVVGCHDTDSGFKTHIELTRPALRIVARGLRNQLSLLPVRLILKYNISIDEPKGENEDGACGCNAGVFDKPEVHAGAANLLSPTRPPR
jgi:hypothetical protein